MVLPCLDVVGSASHHTHCEQDWVLRRQSEQGWDWVPLHHHTHHELGWGLRCRLDWGRCSYHLGLGWVCHWGRPCQGGMMDQEEQCHPVGFRVHFHTGFLDHEVPLVQDLTLGTWNLGGQVHPLA